MSWTSFWIICAVTAACNFLCRATPMLALSSKRLSPRVIAALEYIPSAAFAALVMSDLFNPATFAAGLWPALLPVCAAAPTVLVALKKPSLGLCILVGVGTYGLLTLL